jgi:hypothetical protein
MPDINQNTRFNTLATRTRDYDVNSLKYSKDFVKIPDHDNLNDIVIGL